MPSTPNLDISANYSGNAPAATDRVNATQLDSDHLAVESWANEELLPSLAQVIRDDDTLVDGIVRSRNLHPEVSLLIASKAGWQPKADVQAASLANINLSAPGATIDGRNMVNGDRFLAKNQTVVSQNGIYVWNGAAVAATRATDADASSELGYAFVSVAMDSGTTQAGTSWVCNQSGTEITSIGGTSVTFCQIGANLISLAMQVVTSAQTLAAARLALGIGLSIDPFVTSQNIVSARDSIGVASRDLVSGGFGDYSVKNQLFIFCGDSTTEQAGGLGYGFDSIALQRNAGGKWKDVVGTINFGGSGYTLNAFVNDSVGAIPTVSTSNLGVGYFDYWGHTPASGAISLNTAMGWRTTKSDKVTWVLCFGINDCILNASVGNLSSIEITAYLESRLRTAISRLQVSFPKDKIVLRVPNPMTARPYIPSTGFPSPSEYPSFGANLSNDQELVEKWNQSIRNAYLNVSNDYANTFLFDVWKLVFGESDTTLTASTQLPYLQDLVHPSNSAYTAIMQSLINETTTGYTRAERNKEVLARSVVLSINPWDVSPNYFQNNDLFIIRFSSTIGTCASNYLDINIPFSDFCKLVDIALPIYIQCGDYCAQKFISFSPAESGSNTRLSGITLTSKMQLATLGLPLYLYQDNGQQVVSDTWVLSQTTTLRQTFGGVVTGGGSGYIDFVFNSTKDRISTLFPGGLINGTLYVGGAIQQSLALSGATAINLAGVPSQHAVRILISGNYSSWAGAISAIGFAEGKPSPRSFESAMVSGTTSGTIGTQTSHAHGLGYIPSRVLITPKSNGVIYLSAVSDATNIYVKGSASNLSFDAFCQ